MKSVVFAALLAAQVTGGSKFTPAQVVAATPPMQLGLAISGGEVWLEVKIDVNGGIERIKPLRSTPPFTDLVTDAVKSWRFSSATMTVAGSQPRRVESSVLVVGIFRPPMLLNGPTAGEPTTNVAAPSAEIPVPARTTTPVYPAQALFDGVAIVEATVGSDGRLNDTTIIRSAPGFDQAALDAARQWTFRAALRDGRPAPAFAYLILGFRQPNTASGTAPSGRPPTPGRP